LWFRVMLAAVAALWGEGCTMTTPVPADPAAATEAVVLVHGLMRTHRSLSWLGARLAAAGYRVVPFDYPSLDGTIRDHGVDLRRVLDEVAADPGIAAIHLVTHSMGGLVTRAALDEVAPAKVRRVVMLAPPNQGSALARRLEPVFGGLIAPLAELSDDPDATAANLPVPAGVEIGVIAASMDHAVTGGSSHLAGEADHLEVTGVHSLLMYQGTVADQVLAFLRDGRFRRDTPAAAR